MSLINQMLKDIDERQGPPSSDSALRAGLVGATRVESRSSRMLARIGLGLGSLLIVGIVFYRGGMPGQSRAIVEPTMVEPSLVNSPSVNPPPPRMPQIAEVPTPSQPIVAPVGAPSASINAVAPASPPNIIAEAKSPPPPLKSDSTGSAVAKAPPAPSKSESSGSVTKVVTPQHQSENLYRDAVALIRQGRNIDAQGILEKSLSIYPGNHDARLVLARLLIDMRQLAEAKKLLLDGLLIDPQKSQFSMSLAHAYLQSTDIDSAIGVLQKGLAAAADDPDYHALLAALLQRKSQHEEAVKHYVTALRKIPDSANWLVGLAISLQAQQQFIGAAEAYQRAIDLGLSPQLAQFSQERLRQMGR